MAFSASALVSEAFTTSRLISFAIMNISLQICLACAYLSAGFFAVVFFADVVFLDTAAVFFAAGFAVVVFFAAVFLGAAFCCGMPLKASASSDPAREPSIFDVLLLPPPSRLESILP